MEFKQIQKNKKNTNNFKKLKEIWKKTYKEIWSTVMNSNKIARNISNTHAISKCTKKF